MPNLAASRIGQIAIVAHDVARATKFYRDTLGLRFLFEAPPNLAFFDCGGTRLFLSQGDAPGPESILYHRRSPCRITNARPFDAGQPGFKTLCGFQLGHGRARGLVRGLS